MRKDSGDVLIEKIHELVGEVVYNCDELTEEQREDLRDIRMDIDELIGK